MMMTMMMTMTMTMMMMMMMMMMMVIIIIIITSYLPQKTKPRGARPKPSLAPSLGCTVQPKKTSGFSLQKQTWM